MKKTFTFIILLTAALLVTGCGHKGPKLTPVTGIITQDGKPLSDVRIEFNKLDTGAMSFAEPDAEGKFTLRHTQGNLGAEAGKYRVSVFQKGKPVPLPAGKTAEDVPEEQKNARLPDIPLTMSDKKPIEIEITDSGENNIVIDLK